MFQAANAELDVHNCLVKLAETRAGCKIPNYSTDPANLTDKSVCYVMKPMVEAIEEQTRWIEEDIAAKGCVPSCTRKSFEIKEGVISSMNTTYLLQIGPKISDRSANSCPNFLTPSMNVFFPPL